jgi:hypothetical protein
MAVSATLEQSGGLMNRIVYRTAALLLAALPALAAHAQLEGLMNKGGAGNLKDMASGMSMKSGSIGNVAGLLQYCTTNNYLGGQNVNEVKDKVMEKVPGGSASQDPGYNDGLKGVLHGSNGNNVDLGNSSLAKDMTKKACDTVLAQAKSFL